MSTDTRSVRPVVSVLSLLAGVVAVGGAAAAWKEMGGLDPAIAKRVVAISIGAAMMIAGNALPKLLPPHGTRRKGIGGIAAERFAGWTFVLAGIPYVALLTFAPIAYAMPAAALTGLAAFAVAGANWVWVLLWAPIQRPLSDGARTPAPESRVLELGTQMALLNLFFAFFWTFATFLVDSVWGDTASRGMVWVLIVLIVIGNGVLQPIVNSRAEASRREV